MRLVNGSFELKFDEDKLKDVLKDLYAANRGLKLGILEGATNAGTGQSIAEYAYWNEFGTKRIPVRPFMRTTLKNHASNWAEIITSTMRGRAAEKGIVEIALGRVGARGRADMQQTIEAGGFKPNAASTIKRKGSHKIPLKDTGDMFQAINFEVTNSKGGSR